MKPGKTPARPPASSFPQCAHVRRRGGETPDYALFSVFCSEPFRLFFPTGLIVSICGVSLWPLLYAGWIPFPPAIPHARLMIEGFAGAFIIGFIATALPRMISAPRLTARELIPCYVLYLGSVGCHLTGRTAWGDALFVILLGCLSVFLGARVLFLRDELPPPGFVLAGLGIACAGAGVVMLLAETIVPVSYSSHRLATLLLYQGFVLLPVLGAGSFLLPRFFQADDRWEDVDGAWKSRAMLAVLCGVAVVGTFALEAAGWVTGSRLIRVALAALYWWCAVPGLRRHGSGGTAAFAIRASVAMILLGMGAAAVFPLQQAGLLHLFFVSGVGLMILTVAARVVLGHSGRIDWIRSRSRPLQWILWMLVLAAATRASADFLPRIMVSHHIYAALCWTIAALIWAFWLFPLLTERDRE